MPANGSNVTVKNGGDIIVKGPITWDDATWILTSAFIIFTMQSGRYTTASLSGDVTIKMFTSSGRPVLRVIKETPWPHV